MASDIFLNRPNFGAFLFLFYIVASILCHHFMAIDYDADIYPQDCCACEVTMNRLDSNSPALTRRTTSHIDPSTFPLVAGQAQETAHRLIVLIPTDSDYTSATRRISELAKSSEAQVLFLGLCKEVSDELSLRRELITLTALLRDARVQAEAKVEIGTNWVNVVKSNYQAGDMIVCFAEQRIGLWQKPLSQILESKMSVPIYILSRRSPQRQSESNWLSNTAAWTGSIGIIAGAFLLQIRIVSMPKDWAQTTLLILSVIAEAWFIGVWNSLFD
jgi:hypothetical protein